MCSAVLRLMLVVAVLVAGPAAAAAPPPAAVWQPHDILFTYMGVTSHYSCEGLAQRLGRLLALVGARAGFSAQPGCTRPPGGVDAISTARLHFETLSPVSDTATADAETAVPANWRTVIVNATAMHGFDASECELLVAFVRDVLPSFTLRNLVNRSACFPHESQFAPVYIRFDVLVPADRPQ